LVFHAAKYMYAICFHVSKSFLIFLFFFCFFSFNLIFNSFPNNFLFFYFIQFAFLHFHTSYFVNFFQQIFYYDSFILTLTLKKTDT
ncbi:hypothetical protein T4C_10295, partial [Trichinella pseudospiralis]